MKVERYELNDRVYLLENTPSLTKSLWEVGKQAKLENIERVRVLYRARNLKEKLQAGNVISFGSKPVFEAGCLGWLTSRETEWRLSLFEIRVMDKDAVTGIVPYIRVAAYQTKLNKEEEIRLAEETADHYSLKKRLPSKQGLAASEIREGDPLRSRIPRISNGRGNSFLRN